MTSETKSKTINQTFLACGTSLGDVPPTASLYVVDEGGAVRVVRNHEWNVCLIGEASSDGPAFEVSVMLSNGGEERPRCTCLYFNRAKAFARAAKNAEQNP